MIKKRTEVRGRFISNADLVLLLGIFFIVYYAIAHYRFLTDDELYYYGETLQIYQALSHFHWINGLNVGIHGFLFKIFTASLFLIFGPSIKIATLCNICFSVVNVFLFFLVLKKLINRRVEAMLGAGILGASYSVVLNATTYLRDVYGLFALLVFIYLVISKSKKIYISAALLLLLDSKEHMFLQMLPGYLLFLLADEVWFVSLNSQQQEMRVKRFFRFCWSVIVLLSLPTLYFIGMVVLGIIPINPFLIMNLGISELGIAYVEKMISSFGGSVYMQDTVSDSVVASMQIPVSSIKTSYFFKPFQTRLSGPITLTQIIFFPGIVFAFRSLVCRIRNREHMFIALITLSATFFVMMRASHGRYLIAAFPGLIFFFLIFLQEFTLKKVSTLIALLLAAIGILLAIWLDSNISQNAVGGKAIISICILFASIFYATLREKRNFIKFFVPVLVPVILLSSFLGSTLFSKRQYMMKSVTFGYANELDGDLAKLVESGKIIATNLDIRYLKIIRQEDLGCFLGNKDSKVKYTNVPSCFEHDTSIFQLSSCADSQIDALANGNSVSEIVYVDIPQIAYRDSGSYFLRKTREKSCLPILFANKRLTLDRKIELQNKVAYIFNYKANATNE